MISSRCIAAFIIADMKKTQIIELVSIFSNLSSGGRQSVLRKYEQAFSRHLTVNEILWLFLAIVCQDRVVVQLVSVSIWPQVSLCWVRMIYLLSRWRAYCTVSVWIPSSKLPVRDGFDMIAVKHHIQIITLVLICSSLSSFGRPIFCRTKL